jgi:hypothetical protein
MGVGGRHAPAAFTPGKDPVLIVQEAGWAPGLVWISAENLAPTGIRSPDLPAHSELLYLLCYPGPLTTESRTTYSGQSTCFKLCTAPAKSSPSPFIPHFPFHAL